MNFSIPSHRSPADLMAMGGPGARTAGDLIADAAALSRAILERAGAGPLRPEAGADEVLILCADRYHFAAALLAVWQAGRVAALPPNAQPETVHALAARPSIRLIVHDTDGGEGLDLRQVLARRDADEVRAPFQPLAIPAERTIATLYTSGSTGEHKRCPKAAAELLGEAAAHVASFHIAPGERFVATVPGHHIYGLIWSVLVPLLSGGVIGRETPFFPEAVAARLAELSATCLVSVPAHLRGLAELDALPPTVARITSSSAPLPAETARRICERFGRRVIDIFGSSETGGIAFQEAPGAPLTPLAGVKVSAGDDGRLLIDSPFLPPEAPRPLPCDDRIELLPDGRFRLQGRLDGVVKIGGKRVSLAEVERRLLAIEGVRDAACLAEAVDSGRGNELWAAAVVAPGLTVQAIRAELTRWLDPVTVPRRLQLVPSLPRAENGKLVRTRLRALFSAAPRPRFAERPSDLVPLTTAPLASGDGYALTFHVPEDFYYFRGHFDGLPILPGVIQLEMIVRRQIARLWPDLARGPKRIVQLKFKQTIGPGADLTLTLRRDASSSRVRFELANAAGVSSQGQLCF